MGFPWGAWTLAATLLVASPVLAQMVGTPGNGPLVPGGPRQGIGPPSITDSVPDLRLRQDGGGIPGAGPPIDLGRPRAPASYDRPLVGARGDGLMRTRQVAARHCETPRTTCRLVRPIPLGSSCSCRTRGRTVRGSAIP